MTIKSNRFVLAVLAALVLGASLSGPAMADGHLIKFRKSVMKAIGGTMGGLAAVVKGQVAPQHAVPLADTMHQLSMVTPHVFPEGSDFGETEALEVIWEKPAEFNNAVAAFTQAASALPGAARTGNMQVFGQAFGALGKSCKGCHMDFRQKKG